MMRDPRCDDTLSAYLDGELSEQERQAVQPWLAEAPDAQQLLNEFQTIHGALRGLPRQHLDPAFRDRVLDQIERAVGRTGDQPVGERPTPPRKSWRLPIGRSCRALVWPAIAIAVSIVLMIIRSEPVGPRGPLAQRPGKPASDRVASKPVASEREMPNQKKSAAASGSTRLEARSDAEVGPRQIGPRTRSTAPAARPAEPPVTTPPPEPSDEPASRSPVGPARAMAAGQAVGGGQEVGTPANVAPASSRVVAAAASHGPAPDADRLGFGEAVARAEVEGSEQVIVVRLAVDRPAVARRTLAKMFDRQHIVDAERRKVYAWARKRQAGRAGVAGPARERAASARATRHNRAPPTSSPPPLSSVRRANPLRPAESAGRRVRKPTRDATLDGRHRPELLLVEATPHKIRQSLAVIRARTDLFTPVAIDGGVAAKAVELQAEPVEATGTARGTRVGRQDKRIRVLFVLERLRPKSPQAAAATSPAQTP